MPHAETDLFEAFRLGKASLSDLSRDYVLFNHGALLAPGGLTFDPVARFVADRPADFELAAVFTDPPTFSGLPGEWDRILVLCPKAAWHALFQSILGIHWVDRGRAACGRAVSHVVWADDPLTQATTHGAAAGLPARVAVTAFGVDTSDGGVNFARKGPVGPIEIVHVPPSAAILAWSSDVFGRDRDPDIMLASSTGMDQVRNANAGPSDHLILPRGVR